MELMQEEVKVDSDDITTCKEEEEDEEEEEEITTTTTTREESSSKNHHHNNNNSPFSSPSLSLSSSSPSTTTTNHPPINIPHHQHQIPWFNMNLQDHHHHHHHHQNSPESHNSSSGLGLKQIDFMELSLGNNLNNNKDASTSTSVNVVPQPSEKEHMFDKVVTPSDVGKLNRLVIPKQHAEKYFPLDSTTNEKGLLLNFEDRNGKLWRFRYSYWNSSQSYVMTKGWSRFVKEKKLDAGDIVSFQRGVGELYRHRLYIDWRRRSNHMNMNMNINVCDPSTPTMFTPFFLPNQPPHYSMFRWGSTPPSAAAAATAARLYSTNSPQTPRHFNYHMYHPFNQQQNHAIVGSGSGNHQYHNYHELSSSSSLAGGYNMRSSESAAAAAASMPKFSDVQRQQQQEGRRGASVSVSPMIIDSVPVAHHYQQQQYGGNSSNSNSAAKRLRLFGVNMECGSSTNEDTKCYDSIPSSSLQPHQHEDTHSVSPSRTRFGDQRGEGSSMFFDLDPSLHYRQ